MWSSWGWRRRARRSEFEVDGLTGKAKGAEYNSDTGMLILQSGGEGEWGEGMGSRW